ncbi:MAG: BolA family transcriptional regulator [Pelagibacteraceae bacterium BACL5 MAG-120820-bin39]|jgi:BolA family transcriptional regulator, general stress-responsive regulator|uniref:BolA/IbaG family iron-sulfur metabolism protein n=1 Tax=Candidatus Pelagibacter sp. TaxID=2024849 RepID=UPI000715141C|nr:MAG: BolA family transcriptional regulator [Pelagibacteraceae bacterium BACL5 MAG-121015-bin10]KRO60771.1 MAG: BolA family transcriptional regulator [Pelagibacteraceae bacterium BACL5 MAG-121128-bin54]KRO64285.1 MAG: BolA family transcriptional regulator [Pelagibacteraceae bacterium BACL5 MAG-120820-bin39]KRO73746.1 MAG: BolA family transcriptional regulator [Pelagibacteraceae bacterium BACL5 MAG-120813-bin20]MDA1167078.1 BolA/IbaG family iron-sulfur metabolism protein [Pseudomonadota bacter
MDINQLIAIIKKKIVNQFVVDSIDIEDKSFLHKNHSGNQPGKYHLKIKIKSDQLKNLSKIESTKKIYKTLDEEMNKFIHSIQILID